MKQAEFKPTNEMINSATEVFECMALVDVIKPVVRGYQTAILKDMQAPIDPYWVREDYSGMPSIILEEKHTYLMKQKDFDEYQKRSLVEMDKAGLKVSDPKFCPLLVAEHELVMAEDRLISSVVPLTGITKDMIFQGKDCLKTYKKYVDLNLKLLASYVDSEPKRCF